MQLQEQPDTYLVGVHARLLNPFHLRLQPTAVGLLRMCRWQVQGFSGQVSRYAQTTGPHQTSF